MFHSHSGIDHDWTNAISNALRVRIRAVPLATQTAAVLQARPARSFKIPGWETLAAVQLELHALDHCHHVMQDRQPVQKISVEDVVSLDMLVWTLAASTQVPPPPW